MMYSNLSHGLKSKQKKQSDENKLFKKACKKKCISYNWGIT